MTLLFLPLCCQGHYSNCCLLKDMFFLLDTFTPHTVNYKPKVTREYGVGGNAIIH